MLKYGIIGMGGLGKLHLSNLDIIGKERGNITLKAICGATREELQKSVTINLGNVDVSEIDIGSCNFYSDYKEMIEKEELDFVVMALPSYLHEEAAVFTLSNGVNILSEKPMALTLKGCDNMLKAAKKSGKLLMIGQCMRFEPAYMLLKEYVDSGIYGKVYRAEFTRYSPLPRWTWKNWILDPALSGGCPLDMHIHDVDMMNYLFGTPDSLYSTTTGKKAELESIFTQYYYGDELTVLSGADWSMPGKYSFNYHCTVNFENATFVINGEDVKVYTEDEIITPELPSGNEFTNELNAFIDAVESGTTCKENTPESVRESVRIVMAEVESAKKKKIIKL